MLSEKQVVEQVERSFIRSAIGSMPRSVKYIGFAVVIIVTLYLGK